MINDYFIRELTMELTRDAKTRASPFVVCFVPFVVENHGPRLKNGRDSTI